MPGVQVARPQPGGVGGGGQQGAARERAAAEEFTAGDEREEKEHYEEHRSRFAGDALEAGELLDLQEVGVVAAGSGLDRAAVPPGRVQLRVGAAHEAARGLFDGGPHGRAGRREQRAQLALVDLGAAAPAPARDDALRAQQRPQEAADLVDRLPGDLADEVRDRAQQRAHHEPYEDPGERRAAGVDEQGVGGAGLVDLVRGGGRAAHAVDGAPLAGGRLGVPYDRFGGDEDAVARGLGAPAQVDVVAHQGQPPVEAAELLEDVAADQHAGGGHGQHRPYVVVLALVLFAPVEAGPAAAAVRDGDADFQELPAVVPAAELRADDRHVPAELPLVLHDAQQLGQGVGLGGAVVVQEPQPLLGLAVRQLRHVVRVVAPGAGDRVPAAGALQVRQVVRGQYARGAGGLLDGLAEAGAPGEVQHPVGAEGVGDQPGGVVRAAGVGRHGALNGAFLTEQPGEGVGQPACTVVGDEHGGDHVPRKLRRVGRVERCGGSVVLTCRMAVHGHRGTGPGSMDCGGRLWPRGTTGRLGRRPTLTAGQHGGPPPVDNPRATGRSLHVST
jgi:hypothetical protein